MSAAGYVRKNDEKKVSINEWFADLVHFFSNDLLPNETSSSTSTSPWALILEAEDMVTLNHLENYCRTTNLQCIIPNPSKKIFQQLLDFKKDKNEASGEVHPFQLTSHQFLDDLESNGPIIHSFLENYNNNENNANKNIKKNNLLWNNFNFSIVWLDYCGNFDSRPGRKRQRDIRILFGDDELNNGFLANCSLFAVTFSSRGSVLQYYEHETVEQIISFMNQISIISKKKVEMLGITCYSADTFEKHEKLSLLKKKKLNSLFIYTVVYKVGHFSNISHAASSSSSSLPTSSAASENTKNGFPVPKITPGLRYCSDWCTLVDLQHKNNNLLAMEYAASDFANIVNGRNSSPSSSLTFKSSSSSNGERGDIALVMDTRLATFTDALFQHNWSGKVTTLLPKGANEELASNIIFQRNITRLNHAFYDNNNHRYHGTPFKNLIQDQFNSLSSQHEKVKVIFLNYSEQNPFSVSVLQNCSEWSDLNKLFNNMKIFQFGNDENDESVILGILINYCATDLFWDFIEVDWLVHGVSKAVESSSATLTSSSDFCFPLSVKVRHVHRFIAPCPKVMVTFEIKPNCRNHHTAVNENDVEDAEERILTNHDKVVPPIHPLMDTINANASTSQSSSSSSSTSYCGLPPTIPNWFSQAGGWDLERLKAPTEANRRFFHIANKIYPLVNQNESSLQNVFLYEPGNFYLAPEFSSIRFQFLNKVILSNDYSNTCERHEVYRRCSILNQKHKQQLLDAPQMNQSPEHHRHDVSTLDEDGLEDSEQFYQVASLSKISLSLPFHDINIVIILTNLSAIAWKHYWQTPFQQWISQTPSTSFVVNRKRRKKSFALMWDGSDENSLILLCDQIVQSAEEDGWTISQRNFYPFLSRSCKYCLFIAKMEI